MQKVTVHIRPEDFTIKRHRKGAQPYHMAAVSLVNVTFGTDSLTGDLLDEFSFEREPIEMPQVKITKVAHVADRFAVTRKHGKKNKLESLTGRTVPAAWVCGTTVYLLERAK